MSANPPPPDMETPPRGTTSRAMASSAEPATQDTVATGGSSESSHQPSTKKPRELAIPEGEGVRRRLDLRKSADLKSVIGGLEGVDEKMFQTKKATRKQKEIVYQLYQEAIKLQLAQAALVKRGKVDFETNAGGPTCTVEVNDGNEHEVASSSTVKEIDGMAATATVPRPDCPLEDQRSAGIFSAMILLHCELPIGLAVRFTVRNRNAVWIVRKGDHVFAQGRQAYPRPAVARAGKGEYNRLACAATAVYSGINLLATQQYKNHEVLKDCYGNALRQATSPGLGTLQKDMLCAGVSTADVAKVLEGNGPATRSGTVVHLPVHQPPPARPPREYKSRGSWKFALPDSIAGTNDYSHRDEVSCREAYLDILRCHVDPGKKRDILDSLAAGGEYPAVSKDGNWDPSIINYEVLSHAKSSAPLAGPGPFSIFVLTWPLDVLGQVSTIFSHHALQLGSAVVEQILSDLPRPEQILLVTENLHMEANEMLDVVKTLAVTDFKSYNGLNCNCQHFVKKVLERLHQDSPVSYWYLDLWSTAKDIIADGSVAFAAAAQATQGEAPQQDLPAWEDEVDSGEEDPSTDDDDDDDGVNCLVFKFKKTWF